MYCKKCGLEFIPSKGLVNYCSLKSRNSRVWTLEDRLKKSIAAKNSEKIKNRLPPTKELVDRVSKVRKKNHINRILNSNYDELKFENLRFRIKYEQNEKCNKCGLNEWLNQPLILELEHKDGNHFNNKRDNLEMLCPNCHSQTETWRGRNKKNQRLKALLSVNLAAKGGNYNRCHKLKREYDSVA